MLKRLVNILLLLFFISLLLPAPTLAAINVNSVTLNSSTSVNTTPSASINVDINVTISNPNNWGSTGWNINGQTCVDHANYTSSGTYTESFTITAPSSPGTYSISFVAYANNACGGGASATFTLTDSIVVTALTSSTPTPSPKIKTNNGSSQTSSTTYYPSVTLDTFSPDPTGETVLTFTGKAAIEQGTIKEVQYSLDGDTTWTRAIATDGDFEETSEDFTFAATLSEGTHIVKVKAISESDIETQSSSYASDTVTIVTTPPNVVLDDVVDETTTSTSPTVTGIATSNLATVSKVEVSSDGGETWQNANFSSGRFALTFDNLDDGNYDIVARATDSAGNIGFSETETLVVDTIPPIIGGNMISIGPQILTPDKNGVIQTVVGAKVKFTVSMRGGVTEAKVISGEKEFTLEPIAGTNLWSTILEYDAAGEYLLTVSAQDGAGNLTKRNINYIVIDKSGLIRIKNSDQTVQNAEVKVYFYDTFSADWKLWDGAAFGQTNPQISKSGKYSFLLPSGKYYLEISAAGFKTVRSQILKLNDSTIVNSVFSLPKKSSIKLKLPIIGEIILSLPSFKPPETVILDLNTKTFSQMESMVETGSKAPSIDLPTTNSNFLDTSTIGNKYVLAFVAPWSIASLDQIPILNEVQGELDENSVIVVFVQESEGAVETFMHRGEYRFTALADEDGESTNEFPITTLPQHFFVDASGNLQDIYSGVLTKEQLLNKLNSLK